MFTNSLSAQIQQTINKRPQNEGLPYAVHSIYRYCGCSRGQTDWYQALHHRRDNILTPDIVNVKRTNFEIDTILDVNRNPEKSSYATTEKRTNFEIDTILDVNRNPEKSSYAAPEKRTNFEIDTILDVNRNPEKSSYAVNV